MRKLSLSVLAASIALIPSGAFAQTMPPPGASFQGSVTGPQMAPQMMAPQMAQMMPPAGVPHRLQRGWQVNPFWMGPQFGISNWQAYGFADPGPGRRWIRYYDDAYLIDGTGRVVETRGGLDWDQYGEQWDMVNGVPAYRGSRAWQPGAQDYAAAAGSYQSTGYQSGAAYQYGYPTGAPMTMPMPMPMPAYGQGQYYGGYGGYGYGGGVVVYQIGGAAASSGASYTEEIIEEYYEQAQTRRRRPVRRAPPPRRPPPGERG